jgi:hypothetical protein
MWTKNTVDAANEFTDHHAIIPVDVPNTRFARGRNQEREYEQEDRTGPGGGKWS